jgi:hypothetical protein
VKAVSGTALVTVLKWLGIGALSGLSVSVGATIIETKGYITRGSDAEIESKELETQPVPIENETVSPSSARVQAYSESPPVKQGTDERAAVGRAAGKPNSISGKTPATLAENSGARPELSETKRPDADGTTVAEPSTEASSESAAKAVSAALREEVAALGLAKAALDRSAAGEVLAHVAAYRVRFPHGHLGPEATYLEMEAELLRGNISRAKSLAARLTSVASPNAKRVREVLEGRVR